MRNPSPYTADEVKDNALDVYIMEGKLAAINYIRATVHFGLWEAKALIEKILADCGGPK